MDKQERLEATEEIRNLVALYAQYRDGLELDNIVSLFAPDAVFEFGPSFGGDAVGTAEIRDHYIKSMKRSSGTDPFRTLHAVTSTSISITGADTATGRSYLLEFLLSDLATNPFRLLALYDDHYRKVEGAWKIQRRRITLVWRRQGYSADPLASDVPPFGSR